MIPGDYPTFVYRLVIISMSFCRLLPILLAERCKRVGNDTYLR